MPRLVLASSVILSIKSDAFSVTGIGAEELGIV